MGITPDAWLEHCMEYYASVSGGWSLMCAFKQHVGESPVTH